MKAQFLKIAGVNSEAEFYNMYPTEDMFFEAHPEAQLMMRQGGEMIKRADGSYSKRGLWDNIRANKGSGKKPTKEMLEQERKIRAEEAAYGGLVGPEGLMIADNDMYGEYMADGGIPNRYRNMGFTRVGAKRNSTRPGKKWMVLAKKGDDYKVVHGGYDGMKDYTQHGSEERRKRFWDRMGGKNSAKATDPFSPLYWHKRFGTWAEGGSTHSGNAWYQVGGEEDNTGWIKTILNYEAQHGSPTGKGLSDWGYHTRQPKTLDEAVGYFQQDYLPKVQDLPMGMRERAADFLYNTGEDARLYMLDQYVRKYENMPNGLPDRGAYRSKGAKAAEFNDLYSKYQSKIDALPMQERVKLMDAGRDYYYRNINTVNGQPSAAYNATWKPRLGIFGEYQAPKAATQSATQSATQAATQKVTAPVVEQQPVAQQQPVVQQPVIQPVIQQPVVEQPAVQTREPYKIQTAPSLSVQQMPITGNYTLPTLRALPGAPLVGPSAAQPTQTVQAAQTVAQPMIKSTDWVAETAAADAEQQANFDLDQSVQKDNTQAAAIAVASGLKTAVNKANPLLKIEKKKTFNSLMGNIQDKFMEQYTNPYSAMNVAGYAGNLIDGINNRNAYNDELNRRRQNYSTDYAYQPTGNNDMSRGQYDMYGQMVPNKIGGNLSYTGMNQKYSSGIKRFQAGGISDFDYVADMVKPEFSNDPMAAFSSYADMVQPTAPIAPTANFASVDANNLPLDADAMLAVIGSQESSSKPGQKALGLRTKLVGPGGKRGSASGTYQMTEGTLKGVYSKYFNNQYPSFSQFKQAFNDNPDVEYSAAKALMQDHIKNYGIYALGAWYQPSLAAKAAKGDLSVMNQIPAPEYGNKVTFGDYFNKSLNNYRKSLGLNPSAGVISTKPGVNISNLNPNLQAFATDVFSQFPGLKISSGNDSSKHMKNSRHYENKAIDIGANSSEKGAYAKLKQFLAQNPQVKQRYGIEDIIDEGDHIHVELLRNGGEVELTEQQINYIRAMGGEVEFL